LRKRGHKYAFVDEHPDDEQTSDDDEQASDEDEVQDKEEIAGLAVARSDLYVASAEQASAEIERAT
jgi:hypothetical protein